MKRRVADLRSRTESCNAPAGVPMDATSSPRGLSGEDAGGGESGGGGTNAPSLTVIGPGAGPAGGEGSGFGIGGARLERGGLVSPPTPAFACGGLPALLSANLIVPSPNRVLPFVNRALLVYFGLIERCSRPWRWRLRRLAPPALVLGDFPPAADVRLSAAVQAPLPASALAIERRQKETSATLSLQLCISAHSAIANQGADGLLSDDFHRAWLEKPSLRLLAEQVPEFGLPRCAVLARALVYSLDRARVVVGSRARH
eukprot:scaffold183876_cov26-Tisochrysis_lutea.AAC.1